MSDVPSTVPPEYVDRLEAGRVVAGLVLAGMRGGEDRDALEALAEGYTYAQLADAAILLLVDALRTVARLSDEDLYAVALRWALAMAEHPTGSA